MVVIRLSRGGAKQRPFYNIVATDRRNRRDGRFLERVGFYNPMASGGEQPIAIQLDRIEYWTGRGAQVSDAVSRLIKEQTREGDAKPSKKKTRAMKKKAAAAADAMAAAEEAKASADAAAADESKAADGAEEDKAAE